MDNKQVTEKMIDSAPVEIPTEVLDKAVKAVREAKQSSIQEIKETTQWFWNSFKQGTYRREVPRVLSRKRQKKALQKERQVTPIPKNLFKLSSKEKYNMNKKARI